MGPLCCVTSDLSVYEIMSSSSSIFNNWIEMGQRRCPLTGRSICCAQDKVDLHLVKLKMVSIRHSLQTLVCRRCQACATAKEGVEGDGAELEPGKQILQPVDNK